MAITIERDRMAYGGQAIQLSLTDINFIGYNPDEIYYKASVGRVEGNHLILPINTPVQTITVWAFVKGKNGPIATQEIQYESFLPTAEDLTLSLQGGALVLSFDKVLEMYSRRWIMYTHDFKAVIHNMASLSLYTNYEHAIFIRAIEKDGKIVELQPSDFVTPFYLQIATNDGKAYVGFSFNATPQADGTFTITNLQRFYISDEITPTPYGLEPNPPQWHFDLSAPLSYNGLPWEDGTLPMYSVLGDYFVIPKLVEGDVPYRVDATCDFYEIQTGETAPVFKKIPAPDFVEIMRSLQGSEQLLIVPESETPETVDINANYYYNNGKELKYNAEKGLRVCFPGEGMRRTYITITDPDGNTMEYLDNYSAVYKSGTVYARLRGNEGLIHANNGNGKTISAYQWMSNQKAAMLAWNWGNTGYLATMDASTGLVREIDGQYYTSNMDEGLWRYFQAMYMQDSELS